MVRRILHADKARKESQKTKGDLMGLREVSFREFEAFKGRKFFAELPTGRRYFIESKQP